MPFPLRVLPLGTLPGPALDAAAETGAGRALGIPFVAAVVQIIDPRQVDELFERERRLVAQHPAGLDQVRGRHFIRELAAARFDTPQALPEAGTDALGEGGQVVVHSLQRAIVWVRWIFFCSWMSPYTSASAVGGQPGTYTSTGTMRSQPRTTAYE